MKVSELIDLNQMIVDAEITVRVNGTALLDQLNIGCDLGKKPPYPTKVPIERKYVGNDTKTKEAKYIDKSINAWDDGRDYWQVKTDRIPQAWLDLEVYSWGVWPASIYGNGRRRTGNAANGNFHGQRINIVALPSGESLEVPKQKEHIRHDEQLEGQMSFDEWNIRTVEL